MMANNVDFISICCGATRYFWGLFVQTETTFLNYDPAPREDAVQDFQALM